MTEPESTYRDDPSLPPEVRFGLAKLEVMRRVKYVQKKEKKGVPFKTVDAADVVSPLREAMLELGFTWRAIAVAPHPELGREYEAGSGKTIMSAAVVAYTYRLTHVASGHFEDCVGLGEGADNADKRAGKCATYAQKYALLQAFLIETGVDDPDNDHKPGQPRRKEPPPRQQPDYRDPAIQEERDAKARRAEAAIAKATTVDRVEALRGMIRGNVAEGSLSGAHGKHLEALLDQRRLKIEEDEAAERAAQKPPKDPPPKTAGKPAPDNLTPIQRNAQLLAIVQGSTIQKEVLEAMQRAVSLASQPGSGFIPEWSESISQKGNYRLEILRNRSPQFVERHDLLHTMRGAEAIRKATDRIAAEPDAVLRKRERDELVTIGQRLAKRAVEQGFGDPQEGNGP